MAKLSGNLDSSGDASLQNGLDTSIGALKAIPPYGHREASFPFQAELILLITLAVYKSLQATRKWSNFVQVAVMPPSYKCGP